MSQRGEFFFSIKDTKSSGGTFLNHVRLSLANQESRPFQLKDEDMGGNGKPARTLSSATVFLFFSFFTHFDEYAAVRML